MRMPYFSPLLAAMVFSATATPPAEARSIAPFAWQPVVDGADFIGIVECTRGEFLSPASSEGTFYLFEARVLESWKGDKVGATLTLPSRTADPRFDYGDPRPVEGGRYLVLAIKQWRETSPAPPAGADYWLSLG